MPGHLFLKVDGIKGESSDSDHKDEIDVLSWSWAMTSSPTVGGGAGAGAGRVSFRDLSISKYIDAATGNLMLSCASGRHISSAVLTARQRGERRTEYLKIKMNGVLITSIGVGEPAADGGVTETVTLTFREVRLEYIGHSQTGAPSSPVSFGWDLIRNAQT
jgi:type VI secretion system secreted protein Hcp